MEHEGLGSSLLKDFESVQFRKITRKSAVIMVVLVIKSWEEKLL